MTEQSDLHKYSINNLQFSIPACPGWGLRTAFCRFAEATIRFPGLKPSIFRESQAHDMAWKATLFRGLILPDTPNKYIILCNIKQLVASLTAPLLRYIYCKDEHQGALPDSSLNLPNELPKITKKVLKTRLAKLPIVKLPWILCLFEVNCTIC